MNVCMYACMCGVRVCVRMYVCICVSVCENVHVSVLCIAIIPYHISSSFITLFFSYFSVLASRCKLKVASMLIIVYSGFVLLFNVAAYITE